jgi:phosphatidylglycerol:prolipoprotein diacylglycerol transferase
MQLARLVAEARHGVAYQSSRVDPRCYYPTSRAEDGPIPDVGGIPINIDPTLFKWDGVPLQITWHGFFTAVGTLAGIWLAVRWATRAGFTEDDTFSVAMWGVIGAIVGARLFHVIDQWDYYARDPIAILKVNEGGLAIYGTIVGGPIGGALYAWRRGFNVARLADLSAPPLILGMAIGRIGDVINGEHHGAHAPGFPLAVVYTNPNSLAEIGIPVHLAVGYEMVLDLVIFAWLVWLARGVVRKPEGGWRFNWEPRFPRDGMLFWTNLCVYSLGRFFIQFYRQDTPFALGLSQAQLLSVLTAMVAVWALAYQVNRARRFGPTLPVAAPTEAKAEPEGEIAEHAPMPS